MPKRIYFGGSFNPFHKGHAAIVRTLHQNFPDSPIVLLPNCLSPFKTAEEYGPSTQQKRAMMQIVLRELNVELQDAVKLEEYELLRPGPCYTADTLQAILPEKQCFFALGWDSFIELPKWKNSQYLIATCCFLVFQRKPKTEKAFKNVGDIQFRIFELDSPCSSSELRRLYAEDTVQTSCLSLGLAAYIEEQGLYRGAGQN